LAKFLGKEAPNAKVEGTDLMRGAQQFEGEIGDALGWFLQDKTNEEVACAPVVT